MNFGASAHYSGYAVQRSRANKSVLKIMRDTMLSRSKKKVVHRDNSHSSQG